MKRSLLEEFESMGILRTPSTLDFGKSPSDDQMLSLVQAAAKRVHEASEALLVAARGIQEAVAGFSNTLAEALENPVAEADEDEAEEEDEEEAEKNKEKEKAA